MTQVSTQALGKLAFSGLSAAKGRVDSNYIRPGHYIFRIDKIKLESTRKSGTGFFVELTTLKVLDQRTADHGPTSRPHMVGEECSVGYFTKNPDVFLNSVKSFIANTMGLQPSEVTEDNAMQVVGDDQPLRFTCVEVVARSQATKTPTTVVDPLTKAVTQVPNIITVANFKREIPYTELVNILTPEEITRLFPGDSFQKYLDLETAV